MQADEEVHMYMWKGSGGVPKMIVFRSGKDRQIINLKEYMTIRPTDFNHEDSYAIIAYDKNDDSQYVYFPNKESRNIAMAQIDEFLGLNGPFNKVDKVIEK